MRYIRHKSAARLSAQKPLLGFGSAGVIEIIKDYHTDTYRAVYTLKFEDIIYVLHVFQKKSKHGITTPKSEIDLVKARLKLAAENHRSRQVSESRNT